MTKEQKIAAFDPNGVGLKNGHFIGLPFDEEDARVVLIAVPWDVTTSYSDGTASAPDNILEASSQLDLYDPDIEDAWKMGIFMRPADAIWKSKNQHLRPRAVAYIDWLENGSPAEQATEMQIILDEINEACAALNSWLYEETIKLIQGGQIVGLVGGEHSIPLGYLQALTTQFTSYGILQIDAHMDLRAAYEGFTYSHASIFYNALKIPAVQSITQVGIRDYCEAEVELVKQKEDQIFVFYDQDIKEHLYKGNSFDQLCDHIISTLPQQVYISFDIDGLYPVYCPNTGTPVPGGLEFQQAMFLIKKLVQSGRQIIGFDLCEVAGAGHEWEGNVGARILYKLSNWAACSSNL